jgi:hypothetical protein
VHRSGAKCTRRFVCSRVGAAVRTLVEDRPALVAARAILRFSEGVVPLGGMEMQDDDESIEIEIDFDIDDKDESSHFVPGDPDRDGGALGRGKSAEPGRQTPPPIPRDACQIKRAVPPKVPPKTRGH